MRLRRRRFEIHYLTCREAVRLISRYLEHRLGHDDRVRLEAHQSTGENRIPGMVERVVYLGNANQIIVRLAHGETIQTLVQNTGEQLAYRQGDPVKAYMPAEALRVLTDTGTAPLEDDPRAHVPAHPAEPDAEEASASNVNV